jgi:DNA-binding CsgD family transcriptional regulator
MTLNMQVGPRHDAATEATIFARDVFSASAVVFFWIASDLTIEDPIVLGDLSQYIREYMTLFPVEDPLTSELINGQIRIYCSAEELSLPEWQRRSFTYRSLVDRFDYRRLLARCGFGGEIDFVFRCDTGPVAVMTVFEGGASVVRPMQIEASHRFIEASLRSHPFISKRRRYLALRDQLRLTRREIEVAELMCKGASNSEIAESLGIGVGTVKSHVTHVLGKTEVKTRAALAAKLNPLY